MGKQTIKAMIEGGKATPGPPIGPSLAPLKINVGKVVADINSKTKDMAGMKVPVSIIVDTDTKEFIINVGSPPTAALIKKELKLDKGSGKAGGARAGDLTQDQVKRIAKMKFGSDAKEFTSQVAGTCRSMGVTIGQGALTAEEQKAAVKSREQKKDEPAPAKEGEAPKAGEAPKEEKEAPKAKEASKEEKPKEGKKEEKKPASKRKK